MPAPQGDQSEAQSPRRRFRVSLPGLLLVFVCVSAGFAASVSVNPPPPVFTGWHVYYPHIDLHFGLLSFASVGAIVALLDQRRRIKRASATSFARAIRLTLAMLIGMSLMSRILIQRGVLSLDPFEDAIAHSTNIALDGIWYVALIGALLTLTSSMAPAERARSFVRAALALVLVSWAVVVCVADRAVTTFLAHTATFAIDAQRSRRFQRSEAFPDHTLEGYITYYTSLAAIASLFVATWLALTVIARNGTSRQAKQTAATLACLGLASCACYVAWYYGIEFRRVSPDLFSASPAATPLELAFGGVLMASCCLWFAARCSTSGCAERIPPTSSENRMGKLPYLIAAFGAIVTSVVWLTESLISSLSWAWWNPFGTAFLSNVAGSLTFWIMDTHTLLMLAMLLAASASVRRLWRDDELVIPGIDAGRTLLTTALFLMITLIAVPTLAAYAFSSWLGPWYL